MTGTETTPRIYVACLAAYNNGKLHGRWIDATQGADAIWEEIAEMLKTSPEPGAEEHAIHDYEGFEGMGLGEYASIERVAELAEAIEEHGAAYATYVAYVGGEPTVEDFQEAYCGVHDSEEAFAEEMVSELGWAGVPAGPFEIGGGLGYERITVNPIEDLLPYLDMERIARDLFCGDYFSAEASGELHIFRSH